MATQRPRGVSSRLRRVPGVRRPWVAPGGAVVDLPLLLDLVSMAPDGTAQWTIEATVDLVDHRPAVVSMSVTSSTGLDLDRLQAEFRWATPLDAVMTTVPQLLARHLDPYQHDFAARGYPDAADLDRAPSRALSDAFLEDVARRYLATGRGYASKLAREYHVSERTVVSWVEKARRRGILGPTTPGRAGGQLTKSTGP